MTIVTEIGGRKACVLCGGEMFTIFVDGKRYHFEDHPFFGPTLLNPKGDPLKHQAMAFLVAASLWAKQGRKVENGLCVWYREPEPIMKHLGGRNFEVLGHKPAVRGE